MLVRHVVRIGVLGFVNILLEHLRHAIRQTAHARRAESRRAPAADAVQLVDQLDDPLAGLDRRSNAQDERRQAANGLRDRGGLRTSLRGVDEQLEGLAPAFAVLVDGDKRRAKRRPDPVGAAYQAMRTRLLWLREQRQ